ncbi:MAG: hypothetical protein PHO01_12205 [Desulfotomaculaceae bacterium]|jgi:hypothetical protein|nr:hypothetical protein [Desulfotomaculaceae bacterium]
MSDKRKNIYIGDSCDKPSAKTPVGRTHQNSVDKPPARKPNGDTKK